MYPPFVRPLPLISMLEKTFSLKARGTSLRTEMLAGLTTFMTIAYILAVNPSILSHAGMDSSSVFVATALSAALASGLMGLLANLPIVLAPSMGQNAFFAYTVVLTMGHSWQFALTAVFLMGLAFCLLTLCNLREALLNCIPHSMKQAMTAGVGLFITFIGLQMAGIVVGDANTSLALGSIQSPRLWVGLFTLLLAAVLLCLKIRGALLCGIVGGTLLGIPLGVTPLESFDGQHLFQIPSMAPTFGQFEWHSIVSLDMFMVVIIFLFGNLFDTMATLLGVAKPANLLDKEGNLPKVKQAFWADSLATTVGAVFGTSPLTTYVESLSGVADGGRTGLMALTVCALFLLALPLAPIFLLIPQEATAGILILVGIFMTGAIQEVNLTDPLEAIPSYITIVLMPLTYSIAYGIMCGVVLHVILYVSVGKGRQLSLFMYIISVIFLLKLIQG